MRTLNNQILKFKKRVPITSLEAAICNVALFKNMKEKQFKDQIFISYNEEGVIVDADSQEKWQQANLHILNFLVNKRISLLTYGYEKEVYEQLIIKGLKQYTRKIKQKYQECPYINIIHYQKLRKSCEYMDREKYVQPLKDWDRKNKNNPNFAFLIVQPKEKFQEVKRSLLEHLFNKQIQLQIASLTILEFIYYFYNSPAKQLLKDLFDKKLIQITFLDNVKIENQFHLQNEPIIKIANYSQIDLQQYEVTVVKNHKNLSKLGLQFVSSKDLQIQLTNAKAFVRDTSQIFQKTYNGLFQQYGNNYGVVAYRKSQRQKYLQLIHKFTNYIFSKSQLENNLKKYIVCQIYEIQFYSVLSSPNKQSNSYTIHRVAIKECPYMVYQYDNIKQDDLDTFLIYLQQLTLYYNSYIVRFYGISIHSDYPNKYYLIFDYHEKTLSSMFQNNQILDNCQVATMVLQILYLIRYLHNHEQPRCIGKLNIEQVYWPMCIILPYLSEHQENSIESDVKVAGIIMKTLLMDDGQEFALVISQMIKQSKYERISISKCISTFEELLAL